MKTSIFIRRKSSFFFICFLFFFAISFSQNDSQNQKSEFWKNVRFGGGIGLGITNGFFSATVAPTAVYQFNTDIALGVGLNGTYNSRKNVYKSTILGGSLIALYNPVNVLQLSAEFEQLNVNRKFEDSQFANDNYWYPAMFLGAGYRTGNVIFGVRYDVIYDEDRSIYAEPWIPFVRVFF